MPNGHALIQIKRLLSEDEDPSSVKFHMTVVQREQISHLSVGQAINDQGLVVKAFA